ncbi:MAG: sugar porter family MFS transporter [Verrucomicrobiota bacterium]|nr:sugar porter family MFS transporter [Verrucomicrobiota bacterium]
MNTTTSNSAASIRDIGGNDGSLIFLGFCSFASALGGLLFGYDLFVISGAKDLIVQHFQLSTLMEGWFVSSAMVGAMLGCLLAGAGSDRFGRKKVLFVASVLLLACSVGCGLAWSTTSLIFFRWIGGVGVGIASMVCPLYISEISPPRLRGRLVTLFQLAICVGIVAAIVMNTWLLSWHDHLAGGEGGGLIGWMVTRDVWRSMLGMESLPALLFCSACMFIAESPRWLAEKGFYPEAQRVLERINGRKVAATELADITAAAMQQNSSLRELLKPGLRRALLMALFLAVVSEWSGITTIWNFGPEIIRGQGIQLSSEMTGMVVIASSLSIFTLVAVWLMDRAGRRRLLFWGNLGCFISLILLGVLLGRPDSASALKVAAAATFVACFAFSMGPIKWIFMSEVFPTSIRGRAVAICSLAVWAADAILNQLFPLIRDHWGKHITFYAFAAVLIPQFFFVWKIMPETKGRSLEEIERSWQGEQQPAATEKPAVPDVDAAAR